MPNEKFEKANIYWERGILVIDSTRSNMYDRHHNVNIAQNDDGSITATGERPQFDQTIMGNKTIDADLLLEEDTEIVKKYGFFGEKIKIAKRNSYVEYKERIHKSYTGNHYLIIK